MLTFRLRGADAVMECMVRNFNVIEDRGSVCVKFPTGDPLDEAGEFNRIPHECVRSVEYITTEGLVTAASLAALREKLKGCRDGAAGDQADDR